MHSDRWDVYQADGRGTQTPIAGPCVNPCIGVFGLGVGMLVAGYSSLESPDPGAEPSDTARPVADRPEVVREEHPDPPAPNQMPED
jgi:hypothetical protein